MRGTPFLQTILIVVVFLLAGFPVYRLTRPGEAAAVDHAPPSPAPDHAPATPAPLNLSVAFAPAPADFEIQNLGRPVLVGHGPKAQFNTRWNASVPLEGVDLVVHARWPSAASMDEPKAVRVIVLFPDGRLFEHTLWTALDGELNDVLTVPGEPAAATP